MVRSASEGLMGEPFSVGSHSGFMGVGRRYDSNVEACVRTTQSGFTLLTHLGCDDLHVGPQRVPPPHLAVIGGDDGNNRLELVGGPHD